jgi:hypothetical protein
MKNKYLMLASVLLISVASFAQKIKTSLKSNEKAKTLEAVTIFGKEQNLTTNADDSEKAQFYFVKGNVC